LDVPVGLEFGPGGNLFVVSNANHSVLRYDGTTGAFIDAFVPNGSGLNVPTDLTFGSDGNLYVCSRNSDKVLVFDGVAGTPLGDFVASGSGGLDAPRGLEFGPDGNLYVCEQFNDSVRRYDGATGAFIDVFISSGSGGLDRANDLVFAPDGVLYVASFDNDLVLGYDAVTGVFLGALPNETLDGPAWLAVGFPPPLPTRVPGPPSQPLGRGFSLGSPAPNPFTPSTTIALDLPTAGHARATIVDVTGRRIATLVDRSLPAGRHSVRWDGRTGSGTPASAGIYFVRIESGGMSSVRKLVLVR